MQDHKCYDRSKHRVTIKALRRRENGGQERAHRGPAGKMMLNWILKNEGRWQGKTGGERRPSKQTITRANIKGMKNLCE